MKLLLVLSLTYSVLACSDNMPTDTSNAEALETSILLNAQIDALEKAKGVEQSLQQMTEAREEEMRHKGI